MKAEKGSRVKRERSSRAKGERSSRGPCKRTDGGEAQTSIPMWNGEVVKGETQEQAAAAVQGIAAVRCSSKDTIVNAQPSSVMNATESTVQVDAVGGKNETKGNPLSEPFVQSEIAQMRSSHCCTSLLPS